MTSHHQRSAESRAQSALGAVHPSPAIRRRARLISALAAAVTVAAPGLAAAAPATPTGLAVTATGSKQVSLKWASTTAAIQGYRVYRNGTQIGTTDAYTPNFLDEDTALANGTNYDYTVAAYDASGTSDPTSAATGKPTSAIGTPVCLGEITAGHIKLTGNITVDTDTPCFDVSGPGTFSLDCQDFTITQNGNGSLLALSGLSGALITHCKFAVANPTFIPDVGDGPNPSIVDVSSTPNARFSFNEFSVPSGGTGDARDANLKVGTASPNAIVGPGNAFKRTFATLVETSNSWVGSNDFTYAGSSNYGAGIPAGALNVFNSSSSTLIGNTFEGAWDGTIVPDPGVTSGLDDAIITFGTNTTLNIRANTISNVHDAGIEPVGTFTDSKIDENVIHHAAVAGIGHYHQTVFNDNSLTGNVVDDSPHAFDFTAPDGSYSFKRNTFTANRFTAWTNKTQDHLGQVNSGAVVNFADGQASDNVFKDNYFGGTTIATPWFNRRGTQTVAQTNLAASTGNVCAPNTSIDCGVTSVSVVGGQLQATAYPGLPTTIPVSISVAVSGTNYTVTNPLGVTAGAGCTQTSATVAACAASGFTTVKATGGAGNDVLTVNVPKPTTLVGASGNDVLISKGAGADTFQGGAGADSVRYGWSLSTGIQASADGVANDGPIGSATDNIATDVEEIQGTLLADTFTDAAGNQKYLGFDGSDQYKVGSSNGNDVIQDIGDAADNDAVLFTSTTAAVTVNPGSGADDMVAVSGTGAVAMTGIDSIGGTAQADTITVNNTGVTITGNGGNDQLTGGTGEDLLIGGAGTDVLQGGSGDDTISAKDSTAETVNCGLGDDSALVDTTDTVTSCETTI